MQAEPTSTRSSIDWCWRNNTRKGAEQKVRAEREVILSGGVINSPQLLMLSGIGEPDQLADFGIETQIELPGVGKNLQDHLSVGVEYWRKGKGPFVGYLRYDRLALAMAQAYLFGKGPATEMSGPVMAFIKTRPELAVPDLQFLMRFIPPESAPWFPGFRKEPRDAFMCRPVLLHPESRGEIRLRSSNPRDKVKIQQNFLAAENDRKTLRDGLRLVREIATQKPLDAFRGEEIAPGPAVQSDDEIDAYVRETGRRVYHEQIGEAMPSTVPGSVSSFQTLKALNIAALWRSSPGTKPARRGEDPVAQDAADDLPPTVVPRAARRERSGEVNRKAPGRDP